MKKRLLLLLCLTLTAGGAAWAEIASGKWNNGHWSINDEGELYVNVNSISSNFSIPDYGEGKAPWFKYRDEIKAIRIGSYCKNIGRNAFYGLYNVRKVTGGENVESIAMYAFEECSYFDNLIPSISFPKCSYVGERAFHSTDVSYISLPLVETYKAEAINSDLINMIDLGSKVKMLRPCSVNGPKYVFTQNPTPPEWERLYSTDEDDRHTGSSKRLYCYPFGSCLGNDVFVIVPKEYLQTYIDYYPSKHPEVGKGYMCASYYEAFTYNKNDKTYNRGKLVAGAPIYEDGQLIGGWYVDEDELKVFCNGNTIPRYESGNAPWNSFLGKVTKMTIERIDKGPEYVDFKIPENAFNATNPSISPLTGIKNLTIKGIDDLIIEDYAFMGCAELETVSFEDCGKKVYLYKDKYGLPIQLRQYAFYGCKNLKSFSSDKFAVICSLEQSCFEGCESLYSLSCHQVDIFVEFVPPRAFYGCKSFQWPESFADNLEMIYNQC